MGKIVDSLKNFYTKQGGQPGAVAGLKSISGVIDKISGLSFGGSGANDYKVTYTTAGESLTCDKTLDEIFTAINSGKRVYAVNSDDTSTTELILTQYSLPGKTKLVRFGTFAADATTPVMASIEHGEDGITLTISSLTPAG